jgi:hypothetical protein
MQRSLAQLQRMWVHVLDCGPVANNPVPVADNVGSYAILVIEWLLSAGEHSDQGLFATDASAGA